ncbi:MAG: hypothetical protein FJW37_08345, partial [Acidobacteria bacterium]|nr:hypothetical protein [Acidobacteriota bacterium]
MRWFLIVAVAVPACLADAARTTVRGKLVQAADKPPVLEVSGGRKLALEGDEETRAVLSDQRLKGAELELAGQASAAGLTIDPIHTRSMF